MHPFQIATTKGKKYCCAKNILRASVLYRKSSMQNYRIRKD